MNKPILLLFSGGLDSTYLLYKHLKEGNQVYAVYNQIRNNDLQYKAELVAIKNIEKYFQKELKETKSEISYESNYELFNGNNSILFQQIPGHISTIINFIRKDIYEVQIGYTAHDDVIPYLDDIKKIYYSYQSLFDHKLPPLRFPLKKLKKWQSYKELPDELKNYICFCPNSKVKHNKIIPCGNCEKCYQLKMIGKFDIQSDEIEKRYFIKK